MIRGAHLYESDVWIAAQCRRHGHWGRVEHVDFARLQRNQTRLQIGIEFELGALRQCLRSPVLRIADERGALARTVSLDAKRPRTGERLLVIAAVMRGQYDGVVVVDGYRVREVAVRRIEMKRHAIVVDAPRGTAGEQSFEDRERVRGAGRIAPSIEDRKSVV